MSGEHSGGRTPSDDWQQTIERHLTPLLGAFTARMAVKTAALRALKRPVEELTPTDVPAVLDGLRPMLNTLIGQATTSAILKQIRAEVVR